MELSCLTWNVLASVWIECKDYKMNCEILRTKTRREKIIKNINKYNADIVMLQEVTRQEHSLFKKALSQYQIMPLVAHKNKWAHKKGKKIMENGNCILLKRGMFQKIHMKTLQLNEDGVMVSICECEIEGEKIVIVSLHLDDLKRSVRNVQLKTLIKKLKDKKEERIIMGGDFNERIKYINNKLLINDGYTSVMKEITPTYYDTNKYDLDNIYLKRVKLVNTYMPKFKNGKDIIKKIGSDHSMIYKVVKID